MAVFQEPSPLNPYNTEVSLYEAPPEEPLIGLDILGSQSNPLPLDKAHARAYKAVLGAKELSVPYTELVNAIVTGNEDVIRGKLAADLEFKRARDAELAIVNTVNNRGGEPLTAQDADFIRQTVKQTGVDPATVFETEYGKEYTNYLDYAFPENNTFLDKANEEIPQYVKDKKERASIAIAKREYALTQKENAEKDISEQSWLGWGWDQLVSTLPGYTEYQMKGEFPEYTAIPGLKGKNLYEQTRELLRLPLPEFKDKFDSIMYRLRETNPTLAKQFAEYVVGTSTDDQAMDSALGLVDVVGAAPVAKGVGFGAAKLAGTAKLKYQVDQAYKQVVKSAAENGSSKANMIEATGDLGEAAVQKVTTDTVDDFQGRSKLTQRILDMLPTHLRLDRANIEANPGSMAREGVNRIIEQSTTFENNLVAMIEHLARVQRVPEAEVTEKAVRMIHERIKKQYPKTVDQGILDVSKLKHEPVTNTRFVEVRVGNPLGEAFADEADAVSMANWYGFGGKEGEGFEIVQHGKGFLIQLTHGLRETDDIIRDGLITTKWTQTPDTWLKGWLTRFRTPDEVLSLEQRMNRKVATYGPAVLQKLATEEAKHIKALAKGSLKVDPVTGETYTALHNFGTKNRWQEWERAIKYARTAPDRETGDLGSFFRSPAELESFYQTNFKRLPDQVEQEAYFSYVRMVEYDRILRNIAVYRNKARVGTEQHSFYAISPEGDRVQSPYFEGVRRDSIPTGGYGQVLIVNNKLGKEEVKSISQLGPKMLKEIKEGRKQVVEVYDVDARPLSAYGKVGDSRIRYVISDTVETKPLSFDQVPRRGGGHWEYDYKYYIKQAKVTFENGRAIYEGDQTIMPIAIQRMGADVAKSLDDVRALLKDGKRAEARALVAERGIPISFKEIEGWFKKKKVDGVIRPAQLSLDQKIMIVGKGDTINGIDNTLANQYSGNWLDATRDGSLARSNSVAYTGERDSALLNTIRDVGTGGKPLYVLEQSELVDPIPMMNRSLTRIINSTFMDDYKIASVEGWLKQAENFLDVKKSDLRSAPFYYYNNASTFWKKDIPVETKRNLEAMKFQMDQFMGIPSETQSMLTSTSQKLIDSIYGKGGRVRSSLAMYADDKLSSLRNPIDFMRGVTFHMALGFWSIPQLWVQAQTFANIFALGGFANASGATMATLLTGYARINKNPAIIAHLDDLMTKMRVPGMHDWKPGEFKEALELMDRTGFGHVGSEYAMRDQVFTPKIFTSGTQNLLDSGTWFFARGEQSVRMGAWYTAYREMRNLKPTGRFTDDEVRNMLERADTLSLNMSRASSSAMHTGVLSIPAQFLTYQIRLAELFWGKRISRMDKARLFFVNSAMYGVPTGIGVTGFPAADKIREVALEHNYTVGDSYLQSVFMEGLPSVMGAIATGLVTGREKYYNVGERFGAPGLEVLREGLRSDQGWWTLVGGAAFSKFANTWAGSDGLRRAALSAMRDDGESYPLKPQDIIDAAKEISSVNSGWRLWTALNTQKWMSKKETYLTDVSAADAIFMTLSGLSPQNVSDAFPKSQILKQRQDMEREAGKLFVREMQRSYDVQKENPEQGHDYRKRAYSKLIAAGVEPHKWGAFEAQAARGRESLVESIDWDFYIKKAKQDAYSESVKTYTRKKQLEQTPRPTVGN